MNERLKIIISAEIDNLKKNVDNAKKQVKSFKDQVADAKKNVDADFKAAGNAIKTGLAVGVGAMAAAGAALLSLSSATEEYRQNQAQLNAAFDQAGFSAKSASGIYKDLFGVIGESDQAVESAANIAMLANSEKEAAKWAELASGVLGTFHDTLQPEAFYEAANETIKLGEATGAFTQMLEQTGVMSVDEFNKKLAACNTEAEKQALMLKVSEDAMGKAGKAYDEATASIQNQRKAQADLDATLATLGETMAPVNTALSSMANDVLTVLTPYIQQFAENYLPVIQEILGDVGEKLEATINWLKEHQTLLAVIATAIGIIATAIGLYNVVAAVKAAMDAAQVTTLGALVVAYAAQAAAMMVAIAPYVLIVAAIAAVIAIIVLCIKHWDKIKEKTKEVVDKIVKWATDLKDKVVAKITELKDKAVAKFQEVKENITNKIQEAKTNVINKFTEIKTGVTNKVEEVKNNVKNKFDEIKEKITKPVETAKEKVKDIVEKIKGFFNFKWSLPKLKVPRFSITPAGWDVGDLLKGSIPKLSVSWNAKGGVFDKPTLFGYGNSLQGLGEAGAEAVVPLEKNTQWLDKIATMIVAKQGGNQPIVLQVDGKTFAEISVNSINELTRLRGSLPLKMM